ncbi:YfzA family protein [Halalkalibacillus halophilus]|uniref:YfzA family protein n=1 Tax=Halalkalibacillus halophilus TaxID=392827 RepID=UPI00068654E6|nr:YfzA family protein [Halalkalibacillus halophilus]
MKSKLRKKWLYTISIFILLQFIFILIDGTFLEPSPNRIGNFASRIVETKLFSEWLTLYENPIFKIITVLGVLHIIFTGMKDLFLFLLRRDHSN